VRSDCSAVTTLTGTPNRSIDDFVFIPLPGGRRLRMHPLLPTLLLIFIG